MCNWLIVEEKNPMSHREQLVLKEGLKVNERLVCCLVL